METTTSLLQLLFLLLLWGTLTIVLVPPIRSRLGSAISVPGQMGRGRLGPALVTETKWYFIQTDKYNEFLIDTRIRW